jgi:voltage-gated potassium channel
MGGVEVIGDATNQEDLQRAGIDRARALIAACDADAENLVVVLTARSMRPDLRIVSRVNEATWVDRIQQAGADVAQSPYPSYGLSLAAAAVSSAVLDLHDLPLLGIGTEQIRIEAESPLIGATPHEIEDQHHYAYVAGLRRADRLHPWHTVGGPLREDDILVVLEHPQHLNGLVSLAAPAAHRTAAPG